MDILPYPCSVLTEKLQVGELNLIIGDALCEDTVSRISPQFRELFTSPNYIVAAQLIFDEHPRYRLTAPPSCRAVFTLPGIYNWFIYFSGNRHIGGVCCVGHEVAAMEGSETACNTATRSST